MDYISKSSFEYKQSTKTFTKKNITMNNKLDKVVNNKIEGFSVMEYDVNIIRIDHIKQLETVFKLRPKAIIFKLYHSGTANTSDPKSSVSKLVAKLTKIGIVCFGVTETGEPTDLHLYESSIELIKSGMVPLYDMLMPVAVHKLQLLRIKENNFTRKEIIEKMMQNFAGEIDEKQIRNNDIKRLQQM
jgi:L-asparaginase/Glu-tRNA(Gln) amidotransferase subunit D